MQQKEGVDPSEYLDPTAIPTSGRILAIDPGTKYVGLAVSDPSRTIATPLVTLARTNWKKLLSDIREVIAKYDASVVVVGLPLNTDGSESQMSKDARVIARKLWQSLNIAVFLEDERVTSYEARKRLWERGVSPSETRRHVNSEAAAIILTDFLDRLP